MTTHDTAEISLGWTIRSFGMPTHTTALAREAWINHDHTHPRPLCFVADKLAQLEKSPIAVSRSLLCATNPYPLTNALEIFKRNPACGAFGSCNKTFA